LSDEDFVFFILQFIWVVTNGNGASCTGEKGESVVFGVLLKIYSHCLPLFLHVFFVYFSIFFKKELLIVISPKKIWGGEK